MVDELERTVGAAKGPARAGRSPLRILMKSDARERAGERAGGDEAG